MKRVAVVLFVLLAACNSNDDKRVDSSPTPTSSPGPTTTVAFATTAISTPESTEQGELTKVTVGDHDGFTRVVFTFADAVPGYSIKPANPPFVQDGSGKTVKVTGAGHLAVRLIARAHDDTGGSTVAGIVAGPSGGSVTQVSMTGDFEGVVNLVIGTTTQPPSFRSFTLAYPSRLVVDVSD
jgi:hypothetical protein